MVTNKTDDQKLILLSKRSNIVSQILFILIIVISVLPWFIPNTVFGDCLLGIFGVQNFNNTKYNFADIVNSFTALNRVLGIIGAFISSLPLLIGTLMVIKLTRNYISGKIFNYENAKLYKMLGIIYLSYAFFIRPLSEMIFSLCVSLNNPVGQRYIGFSFKIDNLTAMFFAIVLILIGQVMILGQKIKEEQEQFI